MIVTSSGSASQGERDTNERQTSKIIIIFVINPTTRELSGQICKPIVIAQSDRPYIIEIELRDLSSFYTETVINEII